jgi:hypothetical protein
MVDELMMRESKLIFVEGLPGLGKSTTASAIAMRLKQANFPVSLWLETELGHPLNVGGDLLPAGFTPGEAFFKHYQPNNFAQESLKRWEEFVQTALPAETINVLDSFPFQNTIRILLQMDAEPDFMRKYASDVEALVQPLFPVLIYFNQPDILQTYAHMDQISAQRGKEWTQYVIDLVTNCPYAKARGLAGYEGVLAFIGAYKQTMDDLLNQSHIPRIILDNCSRNWEACYQKIANFLEISWQ